jgi:hypothetical protein
MSTALWQSTKRSWVEVENFYLLPGGTVMPLKNKYVGGSQAYVQITKQRRRTAFNFGMSFLCQLHPHVGEALRFVPLESIDQHDRRGHAFQQAHADQATDEDAQKMIVIANNNPFAGLEGTASNNYPLNPSEQKPLKTRSHATHKECHYTFTGLPLKSLTCHGKTHGVPTRTTEGHR